MNPDNIKLLASLAAIIAGLFGVVTVPMMRLIKSEINGLRHEIRAEFIQLRSEMKDMENRLNERINTHLVHR